MLRTGGELSSVGSERFTWERPRQVDESATGRVLESGVANHMFVPEGQLRGLRMRPADASDSSASDSEMEEWSGSEVEDWMQAASPTPGEGGEEQVPEAEKKREELEEYTDDKEGGWHKLRMLKVVFDRAELSQEQQTRFLQTLQRAVFAPGEFIVRQGEMGDKFFIITSGKVAVFRDETPETKVHLYQGHFFGEFSLLREEPRNANVKAVEEVQCLYVTKDVFKPFVESDDKFKQVRCMHKCPPHPASPPALPSPA